MIDTYTLCTKPDEVQTILPAITESDFLSVDTEFVKRKTFYAKPAVLQLKFDNQIALIDLTRITNTEILKNLFANSGLKLIHSSSEDLQLFYHSYHIKLDNFCDTQIMADWILSHELEKTKLSYATLVEIATGVELEKSQTTSDWLARPLSKEQLSYAAEDVEYLLPVYKFLQENSVGENRLKFGDWDLSLFDICQIESDYKAKNIGKLDKYPSDYRLYDYKLKFSKLELAQLAAILAWRLEAAKLHNMPLKWILSDKDMLHLASIKDLNKQKLAQHSSINPIFVRKYGDFFCRFLEENLHNLHKFKTPINPRNKTIVKLKKNWQNNLKQFQKQHNIEHIQLISNKLMFLMLSDYVHTGVINKDYSLPKWRLELVKYHFPKNI